METCRLPGDAGAHSLPAGTGSAPPAGGTGTQRLLHGLTEAQRHSVLVEAAPLCILAGAGSGKTRVLTRRIAWRVGTGEALAPHVLALTFTRKAAGELRRRLAGLGIRDQVAAGTFHGVAYAQLRRRWADRGEVPPALLDRKVAVLGRLLGPGHGPGPGEAPGAGRV
ncbi:MAG: UvrD-helicase domain-containing protein, partial [Acidimicrobiales bacterium]